MLYGTGKGDVYGYDEFGNDLYKDSMENTFDMHYTRQGEGQPFGYTGYRYDEISGTYFAQAREYMCGNGRFMAEDVIWGDMNNSLSLNRYIYCKDDPINYIDQDGKIPILAAIAIGAIIAGVVDVGIQAYDIYKQGHDMTDFNNYNINQTVVVAGGAALAVAVPYAAPYVAGSLGISATTASIGMYGISGGLTNGVLDVVTNQTPTAGSITQAVGEGIINAMLAVGVSSFVSRIPIVQRLNNAIGHSKSAITPMAGGTVVGLLPESFYLAEIARDTNKLFAIDQISGAFLTLAVKVH